MVKERSEVPKKQMWNLTTIFESDEKWEQEYDKLSKDIEKISKYKDTFIKDKESFVKALELNEKLSIRIGKIYIYAHLKSDEDTTNQKYLGYYSKAETLSTNFNTRAVYIETGILKLSKNTLYDYIKDSSISHYKFYIDTLLDEREHILPEEMETILSELSPVTGASYNIFSALNNADIKFDDVENEKGEKLPLTHSKYLEYMTSQDRVLRKSTYNSLYKTYMGLKNTMASTLATSTKRHASIAKIRKYSSARAAALSSNQIPESVYDALISAVNKKLPSLHKYVSLRKKALKYDTLEFYDLSVPMIKEEDMKFPYETAKEIILDSLKVMGPEYLEIANKAFNEGWIDYAQNKGKRSGAYSSGTYGTNPYILISYNETIHDIFTLTHELGHSIHSYYTRNNQPYIYGHYTIFLAEIASTTNELILADYLIKKYEGDTKKQASIINYYLDTIKNTLYRQTQFAEFEYIIHKAAEDGMPLTSEYLSKTYFELNKKYFGNDINYSDNISYEWARVPHFYYNFYVYQYATGISAASVFSKMILEKKENATEKYIEFLKSGFSDNPIEILKKAGVDMSNDKAIVSALDSFDEKLDIMEKIL